MADSLREKIVLLESSLSTVFARTKGEGRYGFILGFSYTIISLKRREAVSSLDIDSMAITKVFSLVQWLFWP